MDTLIVKNIRSFAEPSPVRVKPLTLLVGENSTGKTTFLALYRLAWDLASGTVTPNFNDPPFLLGGFAQILNNRVRRAVPKHRRFEITSEWQYPLGSREGSQVRFESAFEEGGAAPRVARVGVSIDDARVSILYGEPKDDVTLSVRDGNAEHTLDRDELKSILPHLSRDEANVNYSFLFWFLRYVSEERRKSKTGHRYFGAR